jgi:hypothetical protein
MSHFFTRCGRVYRCPQQLSLLFSCGPVDNADVILKRWASTARAVGSNSREERWFYVFRLWGPQNSKKDQAHERSTE